MHALPLAAPMPAPALASVESPALADADPGLGDADRHLVLAINAMALSVALGVLIALPLAWFTFNFRYVNGETAAELRSEIAEIEPLIAGHPDTWMVQTVRLGTILSTHNAEHVLDKHRLLAADGRLIAEETDKPDPPAPVIRQRRPVHSSGEVVGWIESALSFRPLLLQTVIAAGVGALLGGLLLWVCRTLPLRAMRKSLQQVRFLASHDVLTGLPNRRLFLARIEFACDRSVRYRESAAVLLLDLDHFKDVNDTLGHAAGDRLLQEAAERMRRCLRRVDTLARLGGDEFAVVLGGLQAPEAVGALAQRLLNALREPFLLDGAEASVSASIGITMLGLVPTPVEAVLQQADLALYRAKEEGRGRFHFFAEEMNLRLQRRKRIERDLRSALDADHLEVHYQPQVDLASRQIVGVEALVRWRHPDQGLIGPNEFIGIAEETGLIAAVGEWVLRRACEEALPWVPLRLAVNLSPVQFRQPGLAGRIADILDETGFAPQRLELEITEGVLLHDTDAILAQLHELKAMGICLAMDDFGTGYSSLGYLNRFSFDKLKIDRCFIHDLEESDSAAAIVRAVIALGRSFGMRSNAEGVETEAQMLRLQHDGCDEAQGYLFGKPMPAQKLCALLNVRDADQSLSGTSMPSTGNICPAWAGTTAGEAGTTTGNRRWHRASPTAIIPLLQ